MTAEYSSPDPGDPLALEEDFAQLARLLDRLNEDSGARLAQADDDLAALELLFDLRESRKKLAEIEAAVEATAAQRMGRQRVEWPGFIAERKGGLDRKHWRNDDVAWAVIKPLAVDANGEYDDAAVSLISQARDRLVNCAQITGWRVTQLRPLGIDPEQYCEVTTGRRTVMVSRAVADAPA